MYENDDPTEDEDMETESQEEEIEMNKVEICDPINTGLIDDEDDNDLDDLDPEERQQLEEENRQLFDELQSTRDAVRLVEERVVKIAELQEVKKEKQSGMNLN